MIGNYIICLVIIPSQRDEVSIFSHKWFAHLSATFIPTTNKDTSTPEFILDSLELTKPHPMSEQVLRWILNVFMTFRVAFEVWYGELYLHPNSFYFTNKYSHTYTKDFKISSRGIGNFTQNLKLPPPLNSLIQNNIEMLLLTNTWCIGKQKHPDLQIFRPKIKPRCY